MANERSTGLTITFHPNRTKVRGAICGKPRDGGVTGPGQGRSRTRENSDAGTGGQLDRLRTMSSPDLILFARRALQLARTEIAALGALMVIAVGVMTFVEVADDMTE